MLSTVVTMSIGPWSAMRRLIHEESSDGMVMLSSMSRSSA